LHERKKKNAGMTDKKKKTSRPGSDDTNNGAKTCPYTIAISNQALWFYFPGISFITSLFVCLPFVPAARSLGPDYTQANVCVYASLFSAAVLLVGIGFGLLAFLFVWNEAV